MQFGNLWEWEPLKGSSEHRDGYADARSNEAVNFSAATVKICRNPWRKAAMDGGFFTAWPGPSAEPVGFTAAHLSNGLFPPKPEWPHTRLTDRWMSKFHRLAPRYRSPAGN